MHHSRCVLDSPGVGVAIRPIGLFVSSLSKEMLGGATGGGIQWAFLDGLCIVGLVVGVCGVGG